MSKGQSNLLASSKKILIMNFIRTPKIIWEQLKKEFNFTVDACASDKNHLVDKYWTKEIDACIQNWDGEIVYCHPMYDSKITRFVKKAIYSKCLTVFLLPASTNSTYFQTYFWNNKTHKPKKNIQVRFLPKPRIKYGNRYGYKFLSEGNEEPKTGYLRPLMIVVVDNR